MYYNIVPVLLSSCGVKALCVTIIHTLPGLDIGYVQLYRVTFIAHCTRIIVFRIMYVYYGGGLRGKFNAVIM